MSGPDGLAEELALERAAAAEHERRLRAAWQERRPTEALLELYELEAAERRIRELEGVPERGRRARPRSATM